MENITLVDDLEVKRSFVDARYLAKKYGVTGRYILMMAAEKRIPCLRLGRKCVRFRENEVAKALEGSAAAP